MISVSVLAKEKVGLQMVVFAFKQVTYTQTMYHHPALLKKLDIFHTCMIHCKCNVSNAGFLKYIRHFLCVSNRCCQLMTLSFMYRHSFTFSIVFFFFYFKINVNWFGWKTGRFNFNFVQIIPIFIYVTKYVNSFKCKE